MSAHTFYKTITHLAQLAYEWLDSQYGTAKMGLFVLSYGCTKQQWDAQLDTLETLHAWLGALLPLVKAQEPAFWGCLAQLYLSEATVNASMRCIDWTLPSETETPEYPTLPDNPADWFVG